jgi:ABC-type nickel/cobalt efflux system permease component RcnA
MNFLFLAVEEPLPMPGPVSPAMRETLIVIGAALLLAVGLLLWVSVAYKRRRRRSSSHRQHHEKKLAGNASAENAEGERSHSHRRRKRRREHRPRNPTLAETGGLPPIRPEGPPRTPSQT